MMKNDPSEVLRLRLKSLRAMLGWTQERLAEAAGMNYKHYQEIERGGKREVRLSTLQRIAEALDIPMYQLFTEEIPESLKVADEETPYRVQRKPADCRKKPPAKKKPK